MVFIWLNEGQLININELKSQHRFNYTHYQAPDKITYPYANIPGLTVLVPYNGDLFRWHQCVSDFGVSGIRQSVFNNKFYYSYNANTILPAEIHVSKGTKHFNIKHENYVNLLQDKTVSRSIDGPHSAWYGINV